MKTPDFLLARLPEYPIEVAKWLIENPDYIRVEAPDILECWDIRQEIYMVMDEVVNETRIPRV